MVKMVKMIKVYQMPGSSGATFYVLSKGLGTQEKQVQSTKFRVQSKSENLVVDVVIRDK
jgi:hypothetical protein